MLRQSLLIGSPHISLVLEKSWREITPTDSITQKSAFVVSRRSADLTTNTDNWTPDSTDTTGGLIVPPYWISLSRTGDIIESRISADGVAWKTLRVDTLVLGPEAYAGLCVTSHDVNKLNLAKFDNVQIK
jgi:hypothetical protein